MKRLPRKYTLTLAIGLSALMSMVIWGMVYALYDDALTDDEIATLLDNGMKAVDKNNLPTAFANLQKVMDATADDKNSDTYFEAAVYTSLVYLETGQADKAYEQLKNLEYREINNPRAYASQYYLRIMALCHSKLTKDYSRSIDYINKVLDLDRRLYPKDTAFVYMEMANLCELYYNNRQHDKAWQMVRRLEQVKRPEYDFFLSEVYYVHGMLLLDEGRADSAYAYAMQGMKYARQYNDLPIEALNLELACRADSIRRNMDSYIANRNTLDSVNNLIKGSEIAHKIAISKEHLKLETLKHDVQRDKIIHLLIIAMMVVMLVAMALLFYVFRKNVQARHRMMVMEKKELDADIERKRLENELLRLKQEKAESELDRANEEKASMSAKLMEHANSDADMEESLQVLEEKLMAKHADFIQRVKRTWPRLSENDIRLMGLLRMGCSPKVIAQALNITMGSMNTTRYRLRKKLGLDGDTELNDFIANF